MNTKNKPNRQDYLAGKLTHREYYRAVADFMGVTFREVPFALARIKASTDPSLNDLPLAIWDGQNDTIRRKAFAAGYKSWSLSETVCVLKELAKAEAGR